MTFNTLAIVKKGNGEISRDCLFSQTRCVFAGDNGYPCTTEKLVVVKSDASKYTSDGFDINLFGGSKSMQGVPPLPATDGPL